MICESIFDIIHFRIFPQIGEEKKLNNRINFPWIIFHSHLSVVGSAQFRGYLSSITSPFLSRSWPWKITVKNQSIAKIPKSKLWFEAWLFTRYHFTNLVFHVVLNELWQRRELLSPVEVVEVASVLDLDVGDVSIAAPEKRRLNWIIVGRSIHLTEPLTFIE